LLDNQSPLSRHDSLLAVWNDSSLPLSVRQAARREAIWALVAGEIYSDARTELQSIFSEAVEDSLWAVVTLELVNLLDQGSPGKQGGTIDPLASHQRVVAFHDRLQELMGRPTDREALGTPAIPQSPILSSAYPNPFNSTVTIQFELPHSTVVRLDIFNLLGQKVATLVNEPLTAGNHVYRWNAESFASGVYLYRIEAGGFVQAKKMMLMK
jgi:hypothetical protein